MTRVTNEGHSPVEAAGQVFPPRRTIDVKLDDRQLQAIRGHRRLDLPDDAETPVPFAEMTVDQLRDVARDRELPTSGSKAELLGRLTDQES